MRLYEDTLDNMVSITGNLKKRNQIVMQCFEKYSTTALIKKVRKVAKTRNRYNQVPHLNQDTTWESDKHTIQHHKLDPRGQPLPSR